MDLASVADELYGLDPGDFTATRDQRAAEARRSGDRETATAVTALRRPSSGAWAVNVLSRERRQEIDRLLALGGALRQAQQHLAADDLRELGRQRHRVVAGLVAEARTLAGERGHPLSDAVAREVEDTLVAALADPEAGEAVQVGRLVRALQRSGFGQTAGDGHAPGHVAPPGGAEPAQRSAPARPRQSEPRPSEQRQSEQRQSQRGRREVERARREAERVRRDADLAGKTAARAEAALADAAKADDEARQAKAAAEEEVDRLARALDEARRAAEDAGTRSQQAANDRRHAEREAEAARRHAEEAAEDADRLSGP